MTEHQHETKDGKHFHDLMERFSTAMLITHDDHGAMRGRPMNVAAIDEDGTLWFATRFDSPKTDELMSDQRVAVTMQGNLSFVSVTGRGDIVIDQPEKVAALWKETWRPWFPKGPKDPELALLRVRVEDAAFWDYRGTAGVRCVFNAVRRALKGERMDDRGGDDAHQRVST